MDMSTLAVELRKKYQGCSPSINYINTCDSRCVRVEYSTSKKLQWFEIWSNPGEEGVLSILRPEKIFSSLRVNKTGLITYMNTKFVIPNEEK